MYKCIYDENVICSSGCLFRKGFAYPGKKYPSKLYCEKADRVVHETTYLGSMDEVRIERAACGHLEYWGSIHWLDGQTMCRKCMYEHWGNTRPEQKLYEYPIAEDGYDYVGGNFDD